MRQASFKLDGLLVILNKMACRLTEDLSGLDYVNLYENQWRDDNVFDVKSQLFSNLYDLSYKNKIYDGSMVANLPNLNLKLANSINCASISSQFASLYTYKFERYTTTCLNHLVEFLHKMMSIFFMMGNDV